MQLNYVKNVNKISKNYKNKNICYFCTIILFKFFSKKIKLLKIQNNTKQIFN